MLAGFAGDVFSMGSNLIDSMKDGVLSAVGSLIAAVVDAVKSAIDAAKGALGIGSPSLVFMQIGQQMMEGAVVGIAQLAPMVQAQIQAAVVPGGGGVTNVSNVTNNYSLTTQSLTRPGGLAMEFSAMRAGMATR